MATTTTITFAEALKKQYGDELENKIFQIINWQDFKFSLSSEEMFGNWKPIFPIPPDDLEEDTLPGLGGGLPTIKKPQTTDERLAATRKDGMVCVRCKTFSEMAEPNQEDGKFKCYDCRHQHYRAGLGVDKT